MSKKILTKNERERLVDAYTSMGKAKIIAKAYGVSAQKVFRLVAQKKRTGTMELELHKPKISEEDLQRTAELIIEEPDITLQEIIDRLNLYCKVPSGLLILFFQ